MSATQPTRFSCCTPRVYGYYLAVFSILFGAGLLALQLWAGADRYSNAVLFASLGIACLVNLARNRTLHCLITGPFFLLVAAALAGCGGLADRPDPFRAAADRAQRGGVRHQPQVHRLTVP